MYPCVVNCVVDVFFTVICGFKATAPSWLVPVDMEDTVIYEIAGPGTPSGPGHVEGETREGETWNTL